MVFTPSRGYMNPTVILRSVGAPFGNLWKTSPEARKRRPVENSGSYLDHEFMKKDPAGYLNGQPAGSVLYVPVLLGSSLGSDQVGS